MVQVVVGVGQSQGHVGGHLQNGGEEEREFLNATRADYDGILALRTADYAGQSPSLRNASSVPE